MSRLDPRGWPPPLLAALPPMLLSLVLYRLTLLPGLGLWDTAEFQAIGPVLGIAHPTGYPTYTLLAWLASVVLQPFGEEALRANLLSALLVSGAVGLVAATVTELARHAFAGSGTAIAAGIVAGVALAVAEEPWRVALVADPHALHLFFVALLLALLVGWMRRVRHDPRGDPDLRADREPRADRWLLAAAVVYGLSLGNHALTLLLAPGIAVFVFAVSPALFRRPRFVAACAAAALLTAVAVYAYIPLRSAMDPPLDYANPETWESFRYLVFGEQFRGTFRELPPLGEAVEQVVDWTWRGLGALALLALVGLAALLLRGRALLLMLSAWFVMTWAFSLGYINAAIERYYLGPLAVVAVLGGVGLAALAELVARAVNRALAPATASDARSARQAELTRLAVAGIGAALLLVPIMGQVPQSYEQVDQSHNQQAREWVESVLPQLEPDAVLISWWSYSTPLWYAQYVDGMRPDVFVVDDRTMLDQELGTAEDVINRFLGERPVYLIRLGRDLPYYAERFELEPLPGQQPAGDGTVHRVRGPLDAG